MRLESDGTKLLIAGAKSKVNLNVENPDLFPDMPDFPEEGRSWSLQPGDLSLLGERTVFATDAKSTNYAFAGCLMEFGENTLGMVATDGRRLVRMVAPTVGPSADVQAVITPASLKETETRKFLNLEQ